MIDPKELKIMLNLAEEDYLIHLGLADRMLITSKINGCDNFYPMDLSLFIRDHLIELGYESASLYKEDQEAKKFEKEFTNYLLRRYNLPEIID